MSTQEITSKVRKLKRLQTKAEEIQGEITAIQNELKALLTQQNTEELKAGTYKILFTTVVSNRFDSKAFNATHQDLSNQYTRQTTTKRFSVA